MRVPEEPRFPTDATDLVRQLTTMWRLSATQVNQLSEGQMAANYGARPAAPTTETWQLGDMVRNSAPAELGVSPNKYIIFGWICVAAGTPGTWQQCRFLTGN